MKTILSIIIGLVVIGILIFVLVDIGKFTCPHIYSVYYCNAIESLPFFIVNGIFTVFFIGGVLFLANKIGKFILVLGETLKEVEPTKSRGRKS